MNDLIHGINIVDYISLNKRADLGYGESVVFDTGGNGPPSLIRSRLLAPLAHQVLGPWGPEVPHHAPHPLWLRRSRLLLVRRRKVQVWGTVGEEGGSEGLDLLPCALLLEPVVLSRPHGCWR